ncbi:cytochrome b-245 chaperone 1-like [Ruditapes philippinarum]|uniref:cytochrome b-245 chaperone 1-like n=1 Tax=Ruditapes philippinarum TaxID=129788 RepID=UPI00295AC7E0|nr:cytochrome b-245 chaperone 1-like [Ruditapes philippinarum]XP_060573286.1 cytochrome b-245 chaperone 1-like [Ruditapes philippinarum]
MVYLTIKEESDERLHFTRQPSLNSWAILVGFSSVGLGIAYYGNDPFWLKAIYLVLGSLIGISCMDDWEECDFNKSEGEIKLKKISAWDLIFLRSEDVVVAQLSEVTNVNVKEEKVNYFGTTYQVVLKFSTGMSFGITESFTFGSSKEHYAVAEKIRNFLNIEEDAADNDFLDSASSSSMEEEDTADETADDFEHIDQSDLIDETDKSSMQQADDKKCDDQSPDDVPVETE